jgi:aldose 1-epimerase
MSFAEFGSTADGVVVGVFTLTNRTGIEIKVTNYGCTIISIKVPDRQGQFEDIVLGFDSLEGYLQSTHVIGAVVGRYANRIANGKFVLDGQEYTLAKNLGPHHLHGGYKGFDKVIWDAQEFQKEKGCGIEFQYLSVDGDEGYPGNLNVMVRYLLTDDNDVVIDYYATTDKITIINLTQHSYFNLNPKKPTILDHELMINGDRFLPVDDTIIPTGEILSVERTPFDFRKTKMVSRDIDASDIQLQIAKGYDHNWILNKTEEKLCHAATLHDPDCGRALDVYTTEPGLQLYTGNFLDGLIKGKNKITYSPHSGLCLETQHFPDSPHHPEYPSVVLRPGEQLHSTTIWKFSSK